MFISKNRWIAFALFALVSYSTVAVAFATDVKTSLVATDAGKIYFNSAEKDVTYGQLYKHTAVFDTPITGELRFPPNMTAAKVPVMVIMHGSSGISQHMYDWSDFFNQMGIATFITDSFVPRGILHGTVNDQSLLSSAATSADGLLALKLLATHPRIDTSKIGIIGFSKGGQGAITTSFEKLRAAVVQEGVKYAVHIPYYAGCTQYAKTTGAPILVLIGSKDESAPAAACADNTNRMAALGANYRVIVYPGAQHGFDSNDSRNYYFARGQTFIKCNFSTDFDKLEMRITSDYHVASAQEVKDYMKSCMSTGWSVAGDPSAFSKSRTEVQNLLTQTFAIGQTLGQ